MAAITINHLHKRYGDTVAVDDVSFAVECGEIFGVLGPNGAGKTTTVECVEGLRQPDRGTVRVLGLDPHRHRDELRQRVGVQLQDSELPDKLTVAEAMDLYRSFYRAPADTTTLLERLGLMDSRRTRYKKLSGGQKQRLSIALALIGQPEVAVLDELSTGLDPTARRESWAIVEDLRDQGITVLLVTHFMEEAERLCDRVALIDAGRVVAVGNPASLTEQLGGGQRIRFRASAPFADRLLLDLPDVDQVTRRGDLVTATGTGDVAAHVTGALAAVGVVPHQLQVDRTSLEDVFVTLTGRPHRATCSQGANTSESHP
ncbi:MAG: type transport system ATP-binding protein [Acidimicrobiaceae bacterium]|jgi:ABC-2 type transport system ATP-binding protein|nr:type transport system ATP-binding protein [Acidimicrobiaceae bacterium]